MRRARVLLADDHKIVAAGLQGILESEFEFVGTVEDGRALIKATEELRPDVIVVDISMPLLNGIEAVMQIKKANGRPKVVFLTMHSDVTYATRAFEAGAVRQWIRPFADKPGRRGRLRGDAHGGNHSGAGLRSSFSGCGVRDGATE